MWPKRKRLWSRLQHLGVTCTAMQTASNPMVKNLCDVASPKPSILDGYFGTQINSTPYIFLQVLWKCLKAQHSPRFNSPLHTLSKRTRQGSGGSLQPSLHHAFQLGRQEGRGWRQAKRIRAKCYPITSITGNTESEITTGLTPSTT